METIPVDELLKKVMPIYDINAQNGRNIEIAIAVPSLEANP